MHLVRLVPRANKAEADDIAFLYAYRLGHRKRFSVQRKIVGNVLGRTPFPIGVGVWRFPAAQHQDDVLGYLLFQLARVFRIDDQRPPHPAQSDMLPNVDMAVIPEGSRTVCLEFVSEDFTRLDCFLGDAGNAIVLPASRLVDPVPVDGMGERRIIGYMDSNVIAFHDMDQRPGHLSVESEYLAGKARSHIDRDFIYRQVEFALRSPSQGWQHQYQEEKRYFSHLYSKAFHLHLPCMINVYTIHL